MIRCVVCGSIHDLHSLRRSRRAGGDCRVALPAALSDFCKDLPRSAAAGFVQRQTMTGLQEDAP